ncbi:MAG TPA: PQQ-dependent sugar dehydrogenase, partial [Anaerolineae bacterium]|nr:PQQ-dependent sugar dehydrogenase [Anaerolineae bacterium]
MLRVFVRFGGALGLMMLMLMLAGSVLGAPADHGGAAQPLGATQASQAASIATDFTIVMSPVVASGALDQPVEISNAGDGSGRLFVLEQSGYIRVIKNGTLLSTPYLTLAAQVACCNERGLLGLEFDPEFGTNGTFYVNYTTNAPGHNGDTVIARYRVANPAADTASVIAVTNLITIDQPEENHNGGDLHFGPDGYLYIGMGDGGGSGDDHGPIGNGQNPAALLGKILRLNVRGVPTYTIPPTNPFIQTAGYRPEIWSMGWR